MKTLKVLTIVAISGLAATVAVNASPVDTEKEKCHKKEKCDKKEKCYKHKKNRGGIKTIFQKLDLTPEQKTAMKENRKEIRSQMKKKTWKHKRGMTHMKEFISADGFDKQTFIDKATKKAQTMIEMRADRFEKTMKILTPEQRVKLVKLLEEKEK